MLGVILSACRYVGPWSSAPVLPDSTTVLWAGAVTDSSARVVARPEDPQARLRLAVDQSANWTDPTLVEGSRPATNRSVRHFRLTDLAPRTTYHYALVVNGQIDTTRSGQFQTFADRPLSFRVALGACARTGSNHPVFGAVRRA